MPFYQIASSGTKTLAILFAWLKSCEKFNHEFVYLDEFDAFYHFELSEKIISMVKNINTCQAIFATHNTNLLTNALMRPDCYFIMTDNRITNLPNATERELREGHNLEKLYKSGEFND